MSLLDGSRYTEWVDMHYPNGTNKGPWLPLWSSVRAVEYYRNGSEHVNAAVGADARTRSTMADLSKRLHAGWA